MPVVLVVLVALVVEDLEEAGLVVGVDVVVAPPCPEVAGTASSGGAVRTPHPSATTSTANGTARRPRPTKNGAQGRIESDDGELMPDAPKKSERLVRCEVHGLSFDPAVASSCVLCRRSASVSASARRPLRPVPSAISRVVLVVVAAGALAYGLRRRFASEAAPRTTSVASRQLHVPLSVRAPLSSLATAQSRVGWSDTDVRERDEDYEVTQESIDLWLPPSSAPERPMGLFVWISASYDATPSPQYLPILAARRIIWAGANRAGNDRKVPVRLNLALDTAHYVLTHYPVDPGHVYVGGFSGGGRTSSTAALLYPDVFMGGIFICGTNYIRDIGPGPSGQRWASRLPRPDRFAFAQAKSHPMILLSGDADMNREEMETTFRAFRQDGFSRAELVVIPGARHNLPPAEVFASALDALMR